MFIRASRGRTLRPIGRFTRSTPCGSILPAIFVERRGCGQRHSPSRILVCRLGSRPGPKKLAKQAFDEAISDALNADEDALREAKPAKAIVSFAHRVVLLALDGQPSAQRLLLSILDREDRDAAAEFGKTTPAASLSAEEAAAEESAREILGDRYDEFNRRFDAAVAAGSVDDLVALAEGFK